MALFSPNEVGRYAVIIIWMAVNIALFVYTYMDYGTTKKYFYLRQVIKTGLPFARGAAMVLNFNCALILLTMSRNLVSLIRSCNICCGQVLRLLDKTITFHRYIAYMICLMTAIHVGAHCFNFQNLVESWSETDEIEQRLSQLEDDPKTNEYWVNPIRKANSDTVTEAFKSIPGVTGVVITLCLILMLSSSTELIRRSYFEVFWYSHHLFVVFYAGLVTHGLGGVLRMQMNMEEHDPEFCVDITHWTQHKNCTSTKPVFKSKGPTTWMFVLVPMIVYMFERCVRFYRYTQKVDIVSVVKHPSKVIEIKMRKQGFKCEAGQYIFIQCPAISQLEWHPFTLTSAPEENYFSVHIRIVGDWTDALARKAGYYQEEVVPIKDMPRIAVDGPFGTSSTDVFKYDVVMCIGAGIGVTPFASILKSLWYQLNHRAEINVKKVYFFWICPETQSFEWFTSLLKHFETQMEELGQVGLGIPWVTVLSLDSFYKVLTEQQHEMANRNEYNFDHPDSFDADLAVVILKKLKEGKSVQVPIYDFTTHSRVENEVRNLYGANVIIFEGIMSFAFPELRKLMDMKVFVDTDSDVRLARRLKRDISERGRDLKGVLQQYNTFVKPAFDQYISPTMVYADIVVPRGGENDVAIDLIVRHVRTQLQLRGHNFRSKLVSAHQGQPLPSSLSLVENTPQVRGLHAMIRNEECSRDDFIFYSKRLMRVLIEHALSLLPFKTHVVTMPSGKKYRGKKFAGQKLCGVSILRAGETMEPALEEVCKDARIGKILIQTNEETEEPELHYLRLPKDICDNHVILMDATVATGAAALMAIRVLLDHDVREENILFVSLIAAESGVHAIAYAYPKVKIVTTAVDPEVNDLYHIIPGIGNFGNRYFGTD